MKFILLVASNHLEYFTTLLERYEEIGENIQLFLRLEKLDVSNGRIHQSLALIYKDVLEFHQKAHNFFKRNGKWVLVYDL
jgi:hypothetical protein